MNRFNFNSLQKFQRGVSLVEVMIAMLLGIILSGGILQMLTSSRQTNRVHEATSRLQENGRMGLEVIARDVRMADFWGCAGDITNIVNNLDALGAGYIDFGNGGLAGIEGTTDLPDTLVLRGGFTSGLSLQPPYGPQPSANIQVDAGNDLEQGDIVFVSDCSNGDIFQITNANPSTGGIVVHNTGATTSPGNYNATNPGCPGANAHCLSKVYGPDASMFQVQQISYSIGMGSEGQPALFRNGEEFLDGIEDFQILYGEDSDETGVANYFVPATDVVEMDNVVSIRFALVTRSQSDNLTGGVLQTYTVFGETKVAADERLRQVYTSTVNIRNRQ